MDIELKGTIVGNEDAEILRWQGFSDLTCPGDIGAALDKAKGEEVTLLINSPGGDLVSGSEIRAKLLRYPGRTKALVQSHAASSATVAMSGCDEITADAAALICVHNPSAEAYGDHREHQAAAEQLLCVKDAILNAYMGRTKLTRQQLSQLMDKDMWITAVKAKEYGLVDQVDGEIQEDQEGAEGIRLLNGAGVFPRITEAMRERYFAWKAEQINRVSVEREPNVKQSEVLHPDKERREQGMEKSIALFSILSK